MIQFNDVHRFIDQTRQQLTNVDNEIERVQEEQRKFIEEGRNKVRALKDTVREAFTCLDELKGEVSRLQREAGQQRYEWSSPQTSSQLDPQKLAWELTKIITQHLGGQQMPMQTPNGGRAQQQV